jgi:predicted Zn-dependent protease
VTWSWPDYEGAVCLFQVNRTWWHSFSPFRRKAIVTHELGHALGLNHRSDAKASVMYSVGGIGLYSATPDDHDIESLEGYYVAV